MHGPLNVKFEEDLLIQFSYIHIIAPKSASISSSTWKIFDTNEVTTIYVKKVEM